MRCVKISILSAAMARSVSTSEIALPVRSAACMMRLWLWPPSMVRWNSAVLEIGGVLPQIKIDALFYQPLHAASAVADSKLHSIAVAQAGPGREGVRDVGVNGVTVMQYCSHAALRPIGRSLVQVRLGQQRDPTIARQAQSDAQAGSAAADNQYVMLVTGRPWSSALAALEGEIYDASQRLSFV